MWGELVGGNSALMMAIIDRLLHHGEVFYLRGSSYRMRGKEAVAVPVAGASASDLAGVGRDGAAGVMPGT